MVGRRWADGEGRLGRIEGAVEDSVPLAHLRLVVARAGLAEVDHALVSCAPGCAAGAHHLSTTVISEHAACVEGLRCVGARRGSRVACRVVWSLGWG